MILKLLAILIIFPFIVEIILAFFIKRTRKNRVRKTIAFPFYFFAILYELILLFNNVLFAWTGIIIFAIFIVFKTQKYVKRRYRSVAMAYIIRYFPMFFVEFGRVLYGIILVVLIIQQYIQIP